jgi:hypothetical protein
LVLVITVGAAVIWWLWLRPQPNAPASSPPASATPATPTFDQARSDAKRLVVKGWDRQASPAVSRLCASFLNFATRQWRVAS